MTSACTAPLSNDWFILFGGATLAPAGYRGGHSLLPVDDVWICSISENGAEWERVECVEGPEGRRVAASLNKLGDGRFLLQGGYDPGLKGMFEEPWILLSN